MRTHIVITLLAIGLAGWNAPSTATGKMAAFDRAARAVKPGRNGLISPSDVRVPSGKINTISPRFSSLSDSLMPPSPIPSRSIGMAPTA